MELYQTTRKNEGGSTTDVQSDLHSSNPNRKCVRCQKVKPPSEFFVDRRNNYKAKQCKQCVNRKRTQSFTHDKSYDSWMRIVIGESPILTVLEPYFKLNK